MHKFETAIFSNKGYRHRNQGKPIYVTCNSKKYSDSLEKTEIVINNHPSDTVTEPVSLHIMMIPSDVVWLDEMIKSLKCFNYIFDTLFIVIDSTDKKMDATFDESVLESFIQNLKKSNIISETCKVDTHLLLYKTKAEEYKKMVYNIFNYTSVEEINITPAYKNAFAYYYSMYNSPTKYLFHIDIPKPCRARYEKSENENDTNYISQCIQLLKEKTKVLMVGMISDTNIFVESVYYNNEYQVYHGNDNPNISLQCFVVDSERWKPNTESNRYSKIWYRHQTEIAIGKSIQNYGYTTIALFNHETNVKKVNF